MSRMVMTITQFKMLTGKHVNETDSKNQPIERRMKQQICKLFLSLTRTIPSPHLTAIDKMGFSLKIFFKNPLFVI